MIELFGYNLKSMASDSMNLTGKQVIMFSSSNWHAIYKRVFDMSDAVSRAHYSGLCEIRRSIRNALTRGLIGEDQTDMFFSSPIGGIPLRMRPDELSVSWKFEGDGSVSKQKALSRIQCFINHLWDGDRELLAIYLQERGLDLYLRMTSDGTYSRALESEVAMTNLVDGLGYHEDRFVNMDS